jgi:hypothetical protein
MEVRHATIADAAEVLAFVRVTRPARKQCVTADLRPLGQLDQAGHEP